ncbi:hypothetical protein [Paracoccus sp. (in: a-proteobacteria)]|uniref:hypothetical protein n=1 Tax=Paracoccus sp. TaxID=267 RepID=UPI0028A65B52|nr:hypothetical protein [Paracoccus sp. (in: a-proteobacteria)]
MAVTVAPITAEVIDALLSRLRPVDRLELDCMGSGDARGDLLRLVAQSRRSRAAYMDGELVCIFGVKAATAMSDTGFPWALTTRAVDLPQVRREFVAGSRVGVEWLGQDFRRLWNLVAEENLVARRWLRWIGFRFDEEKTVMLRGHRFLCFEMEKN